MGRKITKEFKQEAVRLVTQEKMAQRKVASDLDVSLSALQRWVRQGKVDRGQQAGLTTDERVELGQLRRRLREVEMERDILKKATAFFARGSL